MTVSGVGGGALVGWVNTPHAAASSPAAQVVASVSHESAAVPAKARIVAAAPAPAAVPAPAAAAVHPVVHPVVHPAAAPPAAPAAAPVAQPAPQPVVHPAVPPAEPEQQAVASAVSTRSNTPAVASVASTDTCGAALAYLQANSAPGFSFECPGYALGHQAMTCVNVAGVCPGQRLIVISTVCAASYMNEAHNSWIVAGYRTGTIDPYGYCP